MSGQFGSPSLIWKEVLATDVSSLHRNGNVKVQLGHACLSLQQNWFEHNQTSGSPCQIKAGTPLYSWRLRAWCTEQGHTAWLPQTPH